MAEAGPQRPRRSPGTRLTVHPLVWIQVATLCDRVIEATDGTLTLVRLLDRVTFQVADPATPDPTVRASLVISDAQGSTFLVDQSLAVVVKATRPLTEPLPVQIQIDITGPRRQLVTSVNQPAVISPMGTDVVPGVNLITSVRLTLRQSGLYWFNLKCDNRLLARVPMTVRIEPAQPTAPTNSREGAAEKPPPTTAS